MAGQTIVILDFGSQYSQLIARRVREAQVYSELVPWDTPAARVMALNPAGFILSGGPASVYEPGAPHLPEYILASGRPILGICYGMQLLAYHLGGEVAPATQREYGPAEIRIVASDDPLLSPLAGRGPLPVWMSHGDRIDGLPPGFEVLAVSDNSPVAAMGDPSRRTYGLQFHPEVTHTPSGQEMIRRFLVEVCGCTQDWTPASFIDGAISQIRARAGSNAVLCGLSGGVDSAVTAALIHRAIGDQLVCVFIDTGLLRAGEPEQVVTTFRDAYHARLVAVSAAEDFLTALEGVADPEEKRRRIGEKFVRVFEAQAQRLVEELGPIRFLAQGTLYPDVIESRGPERQAAARIKTHHNVGGLPVDMQFELLEPLRFLFKDEVRTVGAALGLPDEIVWRQPFPGPGLAVRCLGPVTWDRLERLRQADAIFRAELRASGLERPISQSFAVLLPVYSVGVMGDARTYAETVALRAVETEDFMTAQWVRLPYELLGRVSNRIVNEVPGVNRVVYDISSKPPATIEWE